MPRKPAEKSFKEIVDILKEPQITRPNKIAEKFKFKTRDRKDGELLSEYLGELCCLTEHCDYRDLLEDMFRDQLICGIRHECIQQCLLSKGGSFTLQWALDIAHSMESSKRFIKLMLQIQI